MRHPTSTVVRTTKCLVVALLALLSIAAAPASQPVEDAPAARKRLAALVAENEVMAARIKVLEAEIITLKEKLAAAAPKIVAKGRASKLHRLAIDGRTLYQGMPPADLERHFGPPDQKSRITAGWLWVYAADGYRLDVVIESDAVGVVSFKESGDIPN